jgi:hypothetical protein
MKGLSAFNAANKAGQQISQLGMGMPCVCLSYATCHAVALCSARRVVYDTSNGRECPYGNKREPRAAHAAGLHSCAPRR